MLGRNHREPPIESEGREDKDRSSIRPEASGLGGLVALFRFVLASSGHFLLLPSLPIAAATSAAALFKRILADLIS